jgi:hypothetical protein
LLCDGTHTVGEFEANASFLFECRDDLRHYAALCLLKRLRDEGLIVIYRSEPRRDTGIANRPPRRAVAAREGLTRSA